MNKGEGECVVETGLARQGEFGFGFLLILVMFNLHVTGEYRVRWRKRAGQKQRCREAESKKQVS